MSAKTSAVDNSNSHLATPPLADTFELYDLRVEVVVPASSHSSAEPQKLMCGAKIGDFFELKGEMMYLPPGQGISIYSIGTWTVIDLESDSETEK